MAGVKRKVAIMSEVKKHAYWIAKKVEDKNFVSGYRYLPQCECSNCGKMVNIRKPVCPYCGAIMDEEEKDSK